MYNIIQFCLPKELSLKELSSMYLATRDSQISYMPKIRYFRLSTPEKNLSLCLT